MTTKRTILLLACLSCILCSYAQNIVRAEYFIDEDPGAGKGKALNVQTSDSVVKITDSMAVSGLAQGFHILSIRTKNATGSWSLFENRSFYVSGDTSNDILPVIGRAEYFIDKDPGTGKGQILNLITSDTIVNFTDSITINSLQPGFHILFIRTRGSDGRWSFLKRKTFYVSGDTTNITALPAIIRAEYFIDEDPGTGKGKALNIATTGTAVSLNDSIAVSSLQPGFHTLSIRTKNAEGPWSLFESRKFFVSGDTTNNSAPALITKAEYFIDKDPGSGKGKPLNINVSNAVVSFTDSIPVNGLQPGFHTLAIRARSSENTWSLFTTRSFYISVDTANSNRVPVITKGEYFIDKDPGVGKGNALTVSVADTVVNFADSALVDTYLPGLHAILIRAKNAEAHWGIIKSATFFVPGDSTDDDKDGLAVYEEKLIYGTDPKNFDTNDDGLGDGINVFVGLPPKAVDTDGDGISNILEIINGTSPILSDTDQDGVPDNLDAFPLDPFRNKLPPPNTSDHTAPVITLLEPF